MKISSAGPAWQLPVQWPLTGAEELARQARSAENLLKAAIVFAMLALTVFDRFGLRVTADYSIPPGVLAMYGLVAAMVLAGTAELDWRAGLAYVVLAAIACLSHLVNVWFEPRPYISTSSLLLLLVTWAPFAVSRRPDAPGGDLGRWMLKLYVGVMLFVAAAGIAQHFIQFVYQPPWLFDFRPMIPEAVRGSGGWNTSYTVEGWTKANGFFLREPSMFSTAMAFAFLCELSLNRRKWVMAVLALALVLSYSGSGLLALGVAMLFPLGWSMVLRLLACAGLAGVAVIVLGDVLNLSFTLNRASQIGSDTSAYCRFVYPGLMTFRLADSTPWSMLLGHGPGSMERMGATCADLVSTAYAKALFEYGLLGAAAFAALVFGGLARSGAPLRVRIAAGVAWLLLGGLFNSEIVLFLFLLCAIWPQALAQGPAGPQGAR